MNINKFESKCELPPGEITKAIAEVFPKFTKHELSLIRHPEHGVVLAPKACRHLKAKYEPPKPKEPSYRIFVKFTEKEYYSILDMAEKCSVKAPELLHNIICGGKE